MSNFLTRVAAVATVAVGALAASAVQAADVSVQWFGQAAFKIVSPGGKVIMIDPFITRNPKTPDDMKDLAAIGPVDLILVTHGHGDHVGDTFRLAEMTGALVAMNADMGSTYNSIGAMDPKKLIRFNKSGPIRPIGDGITITMTHAEHSSSVSWTDPVSGKSQVLPGGEPSGYIVRLENGYRIYHAGDTGVFGDMAFIGKYYKPDLALLPIGGHFTMGPQHAAYAIKELLRTPNVVPMHYGTFPPLKGTPEKLIEALGNSPTNVIVMQPGDTRQF